MSDDLKWIIGLGLGVASLAAGAFWRLVAMIRATNDRADVLHSRINRVRDEMVHKSDYDNHFQRLSDEMRAMRDSQSKQSDQITSRIDALMQAVVQRNNDRG